MTFGSFISTRRKEAKLNLRDTAKHLGISNGYLCDIEQGRRPAPEEAFVERMINTSTAGDAALSVAKKSQGERLTGSAAATMETKQTALPRRFQNQKLRRLSCGSTTS